MKSDQKSNNEHMANVVEQRAGVGTSEIVSGWQAILEDLLRRMQPYLSPGLLVTFQHLAEAEVAFFERLHDVVRIPRSAAGIYLPPSVREQMIGEKRISTGDSAQPGAAVVVVSRHGEFDVIVNALLAFSPFTPAIDVYERGQLAAGYQFATIDACRADLSNVLERHLEKIK